MQMTGAEVMVKCLAEQGVTTVFGYPGGAILPFYDALREAADIRHILTAHEQGAAHAADGYARAGGQVGVCIATSGPGATNLVTGLAAPRLVPRKGIRIPQNASCIMLYLLVVKYN